MFELGKIYIRSIIATISICVTLCYLQNAEYLTEAFAAIVAVVYLDKEISGGE